MNDGDAFSFHFSHTERKKKQKNKRKKKKATHFFSVFMQGCSLIAKSKENNTFLAWLALAFFASFNPYFSEMLPHSLFSLFPFFLVAHHMQCMGESKHITMWL
jgi:hypothetical protein